MKKSLLVAALLTGFAGAAQANTSVTLYGLLDGGVGYTKFKNDTASASKTGGLGWRSLEQSLGLAGQRRSG